MIQLLRTCRDSPTLATWLNLSVQSVAFLVLLPLSVAALEPASVTVLYLLLTALGFQVIFNFGFQPTFSRLIAFASGGLAVESMADLRNASLSSPEPANWSMGVNTDSLRRVCAAMRMVNARIAWIALGLLVLAGTASMLRPVGHLAVPADGWAAWAVVLAGSFLRIRYNSYQTFLTGSGKVALVQRWQALFNGLSILSMILVLFLFPSLTGVVLAHQAWVMGNVWAFRRFAERESSDRLGAWMRDQPDRAVIRLAWRTAWRSGVGMAGSRLTQQSLGFFYAQFGSSASVATFLIGMRVIDAIENFSMAPFYSRIPRLNRLKAGRQDDELERCAHRGMQASHWVYFASFLGASLAGPLLLNHFESGVVFPPPALWFTLGLAFMLQRYGAMHLQLYSTSNHIVWHWVSGAQGFVTLAFAAMLAKGHGAPGLAAAILLGNLVYAVACGTVSLGQLRVPPVPFEARSFVPALLAFGLFAWLQLKFDLSGAFTESLRGLAGLIR